jgi:group I intron endonuclease
LRKEFKKSEGNENLVGDEKITRYYSNADTEKVQILSDNKGLAGIYMWTHIESNKRYIGSAVNLRARLLYYFNVNYLNRNKNMYICNALLSYGYSGFSFTILEYINISNLSLPATFDRGEEKENVRKLILDREQYYIDSLNPEYNILKTAGSILGYNHTKDTIAKLSEANKGKSLSIETIAKIREANVGENHPMFGKIHSKETKALMSVAKGTAIFVYDSNGLLVNKFSSANAAAKEYNCHHYTILSYAKSGKLFKKEWIFSMVEKDSVN